MKAVPIAMTRSRPAVALLPWTVVLMLRASILLLVPGAWLSAVVLVSGCEDVRLPALVPDGGPGTGGAGGTAGTAGGGAGGDDEPDCKPPTTECDHACHDIEVSNQHCGGCDNSCSGGTSCSGGQCVCPDGEEKCDGFCIHTDTDPQNCGECGQECSSGVCSSGECE